MVGTVAQFRFSVPAVPLQKGFLCISPGSEKGVFWKRGLFKNAHLLEILENLEILEIRENPQTAENKGESDHFLERF